MRPLISDKFTYLDKTIQVRNADGFDQAQALVAVGEGERAMDAIRAALMRMYSSKQELRIARLAMSERSHWIALLSGVMVALAAITLALVIATYFRRDLRLRERARAELHEQKEWFSTTLSSIGDAVIVTDAKGNVSCMNNVAKTLTGEGSAAAGQRLTDIFKTINQSTRQRSEDPVAKVLASGAIEKLSNHTVLVARDGKEYPIDDSAAPIRGADGEILGVVLVFRDVSEVRAADAALRESERQLRLITDVEPIYLVRIDNQRRHLFVNEAYAQRYVLNRDAVIGKRIPEVVGEEGTPHSSPMLFVRLPAKQSSSTSTYPIKM